MVQLSKSAGWVHIQISTTLNTTTTIPTSTEGQGVEEGEEACEGENVGRLEGELEDGEGARHTQDTNANHERLSILLIAIKWFLDSGNAIFDTLSSTLSFDAAAQEGTPQSDVVVRPSTFAVLCLSIPIMRLSTPCQTLHQTISGAELESFLATLHSLDTDGKPHNSRVYAQLPLSSIGGAP